MAAPIGSAVSGAKLIENLLEPGLPALAVAVAVAAALFEARIVSGLGRVGGLGRIGRLGGDRRLRRTGRGRGDIGRGALQDLVQFAAVQPDAPAGRAIVDLDALALAHHQRDGAMGAGHGAGHSSLHQGGSVVGPRWGAGADWQCGPARTRKRARVAKASFWSTFVAMNGDFRRIVAFCRECVSAFAKTAFCPKKREKRGRDRFASILPKAGPGAANLFSSLRCEKGRLVRDRGGGGGLPLPPSSPRGAARIEKILSIP